jgi:hypothetical protein
MFSSSRVSDGFVVAQGVPDFQMPVRELSENLW